MTRKDFIKSAMAFSLCPSVMGGQSENEKYFVVCNTFIIDKDSRIPAKTSAINLKNLLFTKEEGIKLINKNSEESRKCYKLVKFKEAKIDLEIYYIYNKNKNITYKNFNFNDLEKLNKELIKENEFCYCMLKIK